MTNPFYIYLGGPMAGLPPAGSEVTGWRDEVMSFFRARAALYGPPLRPVIILDPTRGARGQLSDAQANGSLARSVVAWDLADLDQADLALFNLEHVHERTVGSFMEMMYCYLIGTPIIVIIPESSCLYNYPSPWIKTVATRIYDNQPAACFDIYRYWIGPRGQ